jgi:serine/threonine protein kinase
MNGESGDHREGASGSAAPALSELAASRVGQVVGDRWRLESVIGVGGTASVYAARHRNGREAALKVLHPELARDARSRKRFLREAYAANRVGHPGAVAVIDDGLMPDGTPFLLLELIAGTPLTAFANGSSRLPVAEVVEIGAGILDVLAAAHDAGVVHRDIKPSNVILTRERRVMLLDFGIAKFQVAGDHDPLLTRSESSLGTPAFMSPEQSAGRSAEVDARSDLWSLGATLFWLLTGRFVHAGTSSNELLIASATTRARSVATLRDDLPSCVVNAVDRALALDRAQRWPNARAMKAALVGMADDDPASVITIPDQGVQPVRRRAWSAWALAGGGALLAVASVAWFLASGASSAQEHDATTASRTAAPPLAAFPATAPVEVPVVTRAPSNEVLPAAPAPRREPATLKVRATRAPAAPPPSASAAVASRPKDALFDRRQ